MFVAVQHERNKTTSRESRKFVGMTIPTPREHVLQCRLSENVGLGS